MMLTNIVDKSILKLTLEEFKKGAPQYADNPSERGKRVCSGGYYSYIPPLGSPQVDSWQINCWDGGNG